MPILIPPPPVLEWKVVREAIGAITRTVLPTSALPEYSGALVVYDSWEWTPDVGRSFAFLKNSGDFNDNRVRAIMIGIQAIESVGVDDSGVPLYIGLGGAPDSQTDFDLIIRVFGFWSYLFADNAASYIGVAWRQAELDVRMLMTAYIKNRVWLGLDPAQNTTKMIKLVHNPRMSAPLDTYKTPDGDMFIAAQIEMRVRVEDRF
jgi:hypothetical protein